MLVIRNLKTLSGLSFQLECSEKTRVVEFKELIAQKLGQKYYPSRFQNLVFKGKFLEDNQELCDLSTGGKEDYFVVLIVPPALKPWLKFDEDSPAKSVQITESKESVIESATGEDVQKKDLENTLEGPIRQNSVQENVQPAVLTEVRNELMERTSIVPEGRVETRKDKGTIKESDAFYRSHDTENVEITKPKKEEMDEYMDSVPLDSIPIDSIQKIEAKAKTQLGVGHKSTDGEISRKTDSKKDVVDEQNRLKRLGMELKQDKNRRSSSKITRERDQAVKGIETKDFASTYPASINPSSRRQTDVDQRHVSSSLTEEEERRRKRMIKFGPAIPLVSSPTDIRGKRSGTATNELESKSYRRDRKA